MTVRNQELANTLGQVLHDLRIEKKFSQERLAELSGYDRAYVSEVERARKAVSVEALRAFLLALDEAPASFFDRIEDVWGINDHI